MSFPPDVAEKVLLASGRHCCLCHKFCGFKMELHHIKQQKDGGDDSYDNCIPLCLDCHADVKAYDPKHPIGRKYTEPELKAHRDRWYEKVKNGSGILDRVSASTRDTTENIEIYLRREPRKLELDDVLSMLRKYDFYDRELNKDGKGFSSNLRFEEIETAMCTIDSTSGLMWQWSGSDTFMAWYEVRDWINELNRNGYAGYTDWYLPTLEQAMSLMRPTQVTGSYVDPKFSGRQSHIWTSDSAPKSKAWCVAFCFGYCEAEFPQFAKHVRAVRSL